MLKKFKIVTGFSKSVSNVNDVIHRVRDVNQHQSDISSRNF